MLTPIANCRKLEFTAFFTARGSGHETEPIRSAFTVWHHKISNSVLWPVFPTSVGSLTPVLCCYQLSEASQESQQLPQLCRALCWWHWSCSWTKWPARGPVPPGEEGWPWWMEAGRQGRKRREKEQAAIWGGREWCTWACPVSTTQKESIRHSGTGTPRPGCPSARLWVQDQEFPTLFATPYGSNIPASSSWLLFFRGLREFLVRRERCGQHRQSVACSVSVQPAEAKKSVRLCSCSYVSCLIA